MRTPDDALRGLMGKLPPGWAWPEDPGSVMGRTLTPWAAEAVRFEQAAEALVVEATPYSTDVLLPDFERVLGPDECVAPGATFEQRRLSASMRWTHTQGAARQDYIDLAAALGFTIGVTEFRASTFGRRFAGRSGGRAVFGGRDWAHTWRVTVQGLDYRPARFGVTRFGERFATWGSAVLECNLRRLAPANTLLQIAYVGPAAAASWDIGVWDRDTWAA